MGLVVIKCIVAFIVCLMSHLNFRGRFSIDPSICLLLALSSFGRDFSILCGSKWWFDILSNRVAFPSRGHFHSSYSLETQDHNYYAPLIMYRRDVDVLLLGSHGCDWNYNGRIFLFCRFQLSNIFSIWIICYICFHDTLKKAYTIIVIKAYAIIFIKVVFQKKKTIIISEPCEGLNFKTINLIIQ